MDYLIHLAIMVSIFSILALSLNLVVGYTGMPSITHAAFFGIGAYATAILETLYKWNFFPSVLVGIILAIIVSALIGFVLSKFKDDFFVLGGVGLNFIVYGIMINWQAITGGPLGISGIKRPEIFGINFFDNLSFLILSAISLFLVFIICRYVVNSSFGRALKAVREDDKALSVFGYKTLNYKLLIFVISAGLAAIAGSLFAVYIAYIDPNSFGTNQSVYILSMIILGGLASLRGSVLGALFLVLLPEALRFAGFPDEVAAQMRQLVYGLLLIIFMMYRPQGFVGEYKL